MKTCEYENRNEEDVFRKRANFLERCPFPLESLKWLMFDSLFASL